MVTSDSVTATAFATTLGAAGLWLVITLAAASAFVHDGRLVVLRGADTIHHEWRNRVTRRKKRVALGRHTPSELVPNLAQLLA